MTSFTLRNDPDTGQVVLDWDASDDADGYLIYGRRASGTYSLIAMRTDNTYVDPLASTTITNYYWVFPYYWENGNVIPGEASEVVTGLAL